MKVYVHEPVWYKTVVVSRDELYKQFQFDIKIACLFFRIMVKCFYQMWKTCNAALIHASGRTGNGGFL